MKYTKIMYNLRKERELKQKDIALILNTTKQNYSMIEKGKRKLSIEDLIKLSKYYEVTTDYILGITKERTYKANMGNPT